MRFATNRIAGVNGVTLTLKKGQWLTLTGPSGSGKTTLVKAIYGLYDLQKGSIEWNGEQVTGPVENLVPGHEDMSLIDQQFDLLPNHTVEENVGRHLQFYSKTEYRSRVNQMLKLVGLLPHRKKKPKELSGGQQQRLAIAAALAEPPGLLLMDEPFSNIDPLLSRPIMNYLVELAKAGTTIIYVTHDAREALSWGDQVAFVEKGKIKQRAAAKKIYNEPKSISIAHYFGRCNWLSKELIDELDIESSLDFDRRWMVRPELLGVKSDGLDFTVSSCEFVGHFHWVMASRKGESLQVMSSKQYEPGETIRIGRLH